VFVKPKIQEGDAKININGMVKAAMQADQVIEINKRGTRMKRPPEPRAVLLSRVTT
jgi:hypothetical protein